VLKRLDLTTKNALLMLFDKTKWMNKGQFLSMSQDLTNPHEMDLLPDWVTCIDLKSSTRLDF
jgi:hypothetical protein